MEPRPGRTFHSSATGRRRKQTLPEAPGLRQALHPPSELTRLAGSPVVELNRAIAIAETEGPEAGLRIVDQLGLDDFRYLHSTRAELLRRLGRTDGARDAYRRARQLTDDGAERRFLERRLTELAGRS
jgi:RNA polymerase sigma-70 factor (ECF subfamily)